MVFINLSRMWHRVHYYLTRKNRQEVDFIVIDESGRPAMAVQVCMNLRNEETLKRELEPLIATANYFNIKENIIVTYNEEKIFSDQGVSVKAVPAWKWLMNDYYQA